MRKIVFSDFDGTITEHDTLDAVQDVYGPSNWRDMYGQMRRSGMSARDVTRKVLESCQASPEQIEKLIDGIGIRAGFQDFVKCVRGRGYEFIIQSEGIDLSIKLILHARGMDDIPYFTNRYVINAEGRPSTAHLHSHPDCPVCGNCKSQHLIEARKSGVDSTGSPQAAIVYIGNGSTDRCPAQVADVVFARDELATWCARHGVKCIPFEDFRDVMREFEKEDFEARLAAESQRDLERKMKLPLRDYHHKDEVIDTPRFSPNSKRA
jgi:2-hydroxy-3-keto-5-methylthiopentenyl-1-phosphate phosphatase